MTHDGICIHIAFGGEHDLTLDDVWPDGDAPDNPTANDIAALLHSGGSLWTVARDWNLDFGLTIKVHGPDGITRAWITP